MSFSSSSDKRDLLLTFGLDKRIQIKDSFFHNANSIIKKNLLDEIPFNDEVTNIEDRLWAQEIIQQGYNIVYEPSASVYHYHGIHHDGNKSRCKSIVNIVENMLNYDSSKGKFDIGNIRINALIPSKGEPVLMGDSYQIEKTVDSAIKSKYIDNVFVITDNSTTKKIVENMGAKCPFDRPLELSNEYVGLEEVYKFSVNSLEESGVLSDLIIMLEPTFPFRYDGLIDNIIEHTLANDYDSVVATIRESGSIWKEESNNHEVTYKRIDSGDGPRKFKENIFIGLKGLCSATRPMFLRNGKILGDKVGLYKISESICALEVRGNILLNNNDLVGNINSFLKDRRITDVN
jgi:CMP-N-acetylneuraminic acid synthetase